VASEPLLQRGYGSFLQSLLDKEGVGMGNLDAVGEL
jgi:hypothetical protein